MVDGSDELKHKVDTNRLVLKGTGTNNGQLNLWSLVRPTRSTACVTLNNTIVIAHSHRDDISVCLADVDNHSFPKLGGAFLGTYHAIYGCRQKITFFQRMCRFLSSIASGRSVQVNWMIFRLQGFCSIL